MADKSISELVAASSVQASDLFVLEQNGAAKKLTGQTLENWLVSFADGHGGIQSLEKTSTSGTNPVVDVYTLTYADTTYSTFTVTNGLKGDTGSAWYVHIKYAGRLPISNSDMTDVPDDYIGIYSGLSATPPTSYSSYTWSQFKGDKGDKGDTGTSILAIERIEGSGTPGTTDTYRVNLNNGAAAGTFTVYNGSDGQGAPGSQTPLSDTDTGVVGTAVAYAHEDHRHPLNVPTSGTPQPLGTAYHGGAATYARSDHVHPASAKTFTVTLTTAGWSNGVQNVSNSDFVTSGYAYFVSPASASREAYNDAEIYADDVTVNGRMTFHCSSTPSAAITVNVFREVVA